MSIDKPNDDELGLIEAALIEIANTVGISEEKACLEYKSVCAIQVNSMEEVWDQDIEFARKTAEDWKLWAKIQAGSTGVGFGMGGLVTIIPDVTTLMGINLRMIQAIGLTYGFRFTSEAEKAELWVVIGSCLGVSQCMSAVGKEAGTYWAKYILRTPYAKMPLLQILKQVAKALGIKLTKRSFAKAVPFLASALGGAMNYSMTEDFGARAIEYFESKKLNSSCS